MFAQGLVFAVLFGTLILFVVGRWRYDVVALLALLVLTIFGVVPGREAFSGFGHPAVVTVAAVLSGGAGIAQLGRRGRVGGLAREGRGGAHDAGGRDERVNHGVFGLYEQCGRAGHFHAGGAADGAESRAFAFFSPDAHRFRFAAGRDDDAHRDAPQYHHLHVSRGDGGGAFPDVRLLAGGAGCCGGDWGLVRVPHAHRTPVEYAGHGARGIPLRGLLADGASAGGCGAGSGDSDLALVVADVARAGGRFSGVTALIIPGGSVRRSEGP